MERIEIDELDHRILAQLRDNADLSNLKLAQLTHASPATCLRRVQRLKALGVIKRTVVLLDREKIGPSLTAISEISLDRQHSEALAEFEAFVRDDPAVLQCYRVSPGPDFVLILHVADMPGYHQLANRLFAKQSNVRNVRTFFVTHCAKFEPGPPGECI